MNTAVLFLLLVVYPLDFNDLLLLKSSGIINSCDSVGATKKTLDVKDKKMERMESVGVIRQSRIGNVQIGDMEQQNLA